jgi:hypothetical protein
MRKFSLAHIREGDPEWWSTVLVTALGSSGKPVPRGHCIGTELLLAPTLGVAFEESGLLLDPLWGLRMEVLRLKRETRLRG